MARKKSESASKQSEPTTTAASEGIASRFQTGHVERKHRSELQGAPYNPRRIAPTAARRLKENLKSVGLLGPAIIQNARTGNIVSGHQRLAAIDALEGRSDYHLDVTVVDLSEQEEREQIVFLNNTGAMGEFDPVLLGALIEENGLDHRKMGFSDLDLELAFAGTEFAKDIEPESVKQMADDAFDADKRAKAIARVKAARKRVQEQAAVAHHNQVEFYVVGVFRDNEDAQAVLKELGGGKAGLCVDGPELAERLGIVLPSRVKNGA